jgi:hypothetical protein
VHARHPQEATGLNAQQQYPFGRIVTSSQAPPHPDGEGKELVEEATSDGCDYDCFGATDVFSFGVMLYIMFTRSPLWFEDEGLDPGAVTIKGTVQQDMKQVARWYFNGKRPSFDNLKAPHRLFDSFPPMLRLLIEGCWAGQQSDRLRFSEIEALLSNRQQSIAWLEPPQAQSYDDWLGSIGEEEGGVLSRKDDLAEYVDEFVVAGVENASELEKLVAMLQEEQEKEMEDLTDMLEDVFDGDDDTQASFRAAIETLLEEQKQSPAAGGGSKDGTAQPPRAAAAALLKLAGLGETTTAESDAVEKARAERDKEKAEKEAALQREKEALAQKEAALAENAELRAQLAAALQAAATTHTPSEGVPSPHSSA